ncbi:MAG: hypothetical protein ACK2T5_03145, partial [Anaerolineales bacterium]
MNQFFRLFKVLIYVGFSILLLQVNSAKSHYNETDPNNQPVLKLVDSLTISTLGELENLDKTKIIDVSQDQPSEVAWISFKGVAADDHYAYLAVQGANISPGAGLWIIDFFYPGGPEIIGHCSAYTFPNVTDVDIQGQYVFLGSESGTYPDWGTLA